MSGKKAKGRTPLQRLWNDWGVFLILAAVIVVAGTLAIVLSNRRGGGPEIVAEAPYRIYFVQGSVGEPAPDGLQAEIIQDIAAAKTTVDVAAPGLDLPLLADELIAAKGRGVTVHIMEEGARRNDPGVVTVTEQLAQAGIEVFWHEARGALGGSFVVIDQELAWAGSWDLSRRGLSVDDGMVVRWEIAQLAKDLHDEFLEMVDGRAFGPTSPNNTTYSYLAIPNVSSLSIYMTPEDDFLAEVLQTLANAKGAIVLLSGGLDDERLGDRLAGEAGRTTVSFFGIVSSVASSPAILQQLEGQAENLFEYRGDGLLRENLLVIDSEVVCIFSQPLQRIGLDENDGYLIIVRDENMASLVQQEFTRLAQRSQQAP